MNLRYLNGRLQSQEAERAPWVDVPHITADRQMVVDRIAELEKQYGSLTGVAIATGLNAKMLARIKAGEEIALTETAMKMLGA